MTTHLTPDPHPRLKDDDAKETGLACFLNKDRMCGSDCMAYMPQVPPGDEYLDQQWAHCMLLVNAHRGGKHLVVLASEGAEALKLMKNGAAATARASQTPPGPVR